MILICSFRELIFGNLRYLFADNFFLSRHIEEIKSKNLSSEADWLEYVGHPVNAFNLIKRWYRLSSMAVYTKDNTGNFGHNTEFGW